MMLPSHRPPPPAPRKHYVDWQELFQIYSAKLILEVFGSTGAVWGFTETIGLRTSETNEFWRTIALCVGCVFFVRLLRQFKDTLEYGTAVLENDYETDSDYDETPERENMRYKETSPLVDFASPEANYDISSGGRSPTSVCLHGQRY